MHIKKAWTSTVVKYRITQHSWNENGCKSLTVSKACPGGKKKTEITITMQSVALSHKAAGKIDCQDLRILFPI